MTSPDHFNAFVRLRSITGAWLVDPTLRSRMSADAETSETNMTDVAVRILSASVKMNLEASGRRATSSGRDDDVLLLRLPTTLAAALNRKAGLKSSMQDVIRETLCQHYDLTVPEKPKASRSRSKA